MTEKEVTRFVVWCTEELKADAAWAAGRHDQPVSLWIKSLITAAVRKERSLEAREARAAGGRVRRQETKDRREARRIPRPSTR